MGRGRLRVPLLLALAVLVGGCATTLVPAPGTVELPGAGHGAIAEDARVRVAAAAEAWRGHPYDLGGAVTPMLVVVENNSTRRLRVRYDAFSLVGADGRRFAAIPPFAVTGTVAVPVDAAFAPPAFYSPGWALYGGPFARDPLYGWRWPFFASYPAYVWVRLPTNDMIQRALPEGVVEPGGKISGFLYFEEVARSTREVTFTAVLVDAASDATFGTVRIPFLASDS